MNPQIQFRSVQPADREFLYQVYASTRREEVAAAQWSPADTEAFLRMQFQAQDIYYHDQFPNARFDLILLAGTPVGRLYREWRADELRIIDIALLPDYRGNGIGTALLRDLCAEAAQRQLPVRIHVEMFNPARRLYERLGFQPVQQNGLYLLMAWQAAP